MDAAPFLKWAGGKTYLLPEILARIPKTWDREQHLYVEPFLGGGAVFFALQPTRAILSDLNFQLMAMYRNVQGNLEPFMRALSALKVNYEWDPEGAYLDARSAFNDQAWVGQSDTNTAARFLLLNKTCFNGLYRVNEAGAFNVSWGKRARAGIPSDEHLQACSQALQNATLLDRDAIELAGSFEPEGALIYCDPPYVPTSKTADFTKYTVDGFAYTDQLRLAIQAAYWRDAGAHVILSQAADESLVGQYRRLGFEADLVKAPRRINSKGTGRGLVEEYIIHG